MDNIILLVAVDGEFDFFSINSKAKKQWSYLFMQVVSAAHVQIVITYFLTSVGIKHSF